MDESEKWELLKISAYHVVAQIKWSKKNKGVFPRSLAN
jgi:hypothetical protein